MPDAAPRSPWTTAWRRFRRDRVALTGACVLAALYLGALFAGFLAPRGLDERDPNHAFHPPTALYLRAPDGGWTRPYVCASRLESLALHTYVEDCSQRFPVRLLARGASYRLGGVLDSDLHLFGVESPGVLFPFGSDRYGRGILSRLLHGSQISLSIGLVGITLSMLIALAGGGVAGYLGGRTDFWLMRLVEVILALPGLYLILVLRDAFGTDLDSTTTYLVVVVVLAFIGWASNARVIRGMVLSLREQDYVLAARAMGCSSWTIITRHLLPNTLSFVIVTATLTVPYYILGEVALSFLGVGITEPQASWGNMLHQANNVRFLTDFPWIVTPGFFIFVTVMAWNFVGDGLRDATDPRALR